MKVLQARDALVKEFTRVSQWRAIARALGLNEDHISWLGPIERVAYRVLVSARGAGCTEDDVSKAAVAVAQPEPADRRSVGGMLALTGATRAALLLGDAAGALLRAQQAIFHEPGRFDREVAAARGALDEAIANFDRTRS